MANSLLWQPPAPVRPDLVAQAILEVVTESLRQPVAEALARGAASATLAAMIERAARQAIEDVTSSAHIVDAVPQSDK